MPLTPDVPTAPDEVFDQETALLHVLQQQDLWTLLDGVRDWPVRDRMRIYDALTSSSRGTS